MTLRVKLLHNLAQLPTKGFRNDAGFDLYSIEEVVFSTARIEKVRTGIAVEIPEGHVGLIMDRSSMGAKGIKVYGGVIDSGYVGEVIVLLGRISGDLPVEIEPGNKIAQLVIVPLSNFDTAELAHDLPFSSRGDRGFGSSGA